jgi:hypothetical protein
VRKKGLSRVGLNPRHTFDMACVIAKKVEEV